MAGVSSNRTVDVTLALPTGVLAVGDDLIRVTVTLRPVTETRTFSAGVRLIGAGPGLSYDVDVDRILVTLGGGIADLDRLTGSAIVLDVVVTGLQPGTEVVPLGLDLPAGVTLVSTTPETVTVTITDASPSASPGTGG
jgi:YbbR domain-containing protein